ncbi:hypothetical protein BOTBODRAFT_39153 [Botryobasidium botryosum FD-172 SS1]|uniref:Uncharacterized protein n=1 Tax=Botryobasidium botryosum (strain FD-172 SS1) TaxID=930990 RepID=A0A067LUL0_BOTB1|nr:hypothetical protein BOTBODRAFT_39153 [Botryobasidium botryosum FD-172 SS1]
MSQVAHRYHTPPLNRPLPALPRAGTSTMPHIKQLPSLPRTPRLPPSSYKNCKRPPREISWSSTPWNNDGPASFYHESVVPATQVSLQRRDSIHGIAVTRRALPTTPLIVTDSRASIPTGSGGRSARPLPSPPRSQSASPGGSPAELATPTVSALDIRNNSFPPTSPLDSMNMDLPLPYFCDEESMLDGGEPSFIEWDVLEAVLGCDSVDLEASEDVVIGG